MQTWNVFLISAHVKKRKKQGMQSSVWKLHGMSCTDLRFACGVRLAALLSPGIFKSSPYRNGNITWVCGIRCLKVSGFHHEVSSPGADWWTEAGNQRSLWSLRYWWLRLELGPGFLGKWEARCFHTTPRAIWCRWILKFTKKTQWV